MRQEQIVIPALSLLEDFLHGIIQEANQQTFEALTKHLTTQQQQVLGVLLANRDETQQSYATWLRQPPGTSNAKNFLELLNRLTFLKQMNLGVPEGYTVNANRLSQLARRCERLSATRLRQLRNPSERYALLVALSLQLQSALIDQTLNMFIQLYHSVFKRAKTAY
ncbi:MAG: hypothetical protein AAFQ07_21615, partial [Chloroflexota bacterium]